MFVCAQNIPGLTHQKLVTVITSGRHWKTVGGETAHYMSCSCQCGLNPGTIVCVCVCVCVCEGAGRCTSISWGWESKEEVSAVHQASHTCLFIQCSQLSLGFPFLPLSEAVIADLAAWLFD